MERIKEKLIETEMMILLIESIEKVNQRSENLQRILMIQMMTERVEQRAHQRKEFRRKRQVCMIAMMMQKLLERNLARIPQKERNQ